MKAFRGKFGINSSGSLPPTPALLQGGLKNDFNNYKYANLFRLFSYFPSSAS